MTVGSFWWWGGVGLFALLFLHLEEDSSEKKQLDINQ